MKKLLDIWRCISTKNAKFAEFLHPILTFFWLVTFLSAYISVFSIVLFFQKSKKNIFYQNGTFLSFVIFLTCRGDFWKENLIFEIGITKCDLTFCWEFSYFLTCRGIFSWKINSYYKVCFYKKSQKEGINVKNDQKVIKNRLLKTDISLLIRPFDAILEPKKWYKW